jgi:hypothetical protein
MLVVMKGCVRQGIYTKYKIYKHIYFVNYDTNIHIFVKQRTSWVSISVTIYMKHFPVNKSLKQDNIYTCMNHVL